MFRQVAYTYLLLWMFVDTTLALSASTICGTVPNSYFVRSSQSCNSYERCMNGQPIHGECPRGFSFNPQSQTCDEHIHVNCQQCSSYGIQNIPHPDSCNMYYRCVNGVRTTMVCADGLLFDRTFGDCNIRDRVVCEERNRICEPFSWMISTTIGNPLDCGSYYVCINGNAFETLCPSGLFFNPNKAACEPFYGINFCQGPGPIITTPFPVVTTRATTAAPTTSRTTPRIIFFTT